jgi:integrase
MAKRANGEGSIGPRPDGKPGYWGRLTLPGGKRKAVFGLTRREVEKELTRLKAERDRGAAVPTGRLTVGGYLDRWLRDVVRPNVTESTYGDYERSVRLHLKPAFGLKQLSRLQAADVQQWLAAELAKGSRPETVTKWLNHLRIALSQALKWRLVAENMASLATSPRTERRAIPELPFTAPEKLLEAVQGARYEAAYYLALGLGLRIGEVLGLRWEDVDLERRLVTVKRSLQRLNRAWALQEPKTEAGIRRVGLPRLVVEALRAHRIRQHEERLRIGESWGAGGEWGNLVFTDPLGDPAWAEVVRQHLYDHLAAAGLPRIRPHDLRHGMVSLLLNEGVSLAGVSKLAGHASVGITSDRYGHLTDRVAIEAADVMDSVLRGRRAGG